MFQMLRANPQHPALNDWISASNRAQSAACRTSNQRRTTGSFPPPAAPR
jgi:hypothetical protein